MSENVTPLLMYLLWIIFVIMLNFIISTDGGGGYVRIGCEVFDVCHSVIIILGSEEALIRTNQLLQFLGKRDMCKESKISNSLAYVAGYVWE